MTTNERFNLPPVNFRHLSPAERDILLMRFAYLSAAESALLLMQMMDARDEAMRFIRQEHLLDKFEKQSRKIVILG